MEGCRGEVSAFVEVDLSTMTQDRLRAKVITRYRKYAEAGGWKGRHPYCPVLLFVTTSEQRATRFLAGIAPRRPSPAPLSCRRSPPATSRNKDSTAPSRELLVPSLTRKRQPRWGQVRLFLDGAARSPGRYRVRDDEGRWGPPTASLPLAIAQARAAARVSGAAVASSGQSEVPGGSSHEKYSSLR